ncbi:hypothetical protein [Glycomyces sp. YM15]|uniref:hypothetical protein n=1 Tax=Glycomyces sp. YM15 TaxID=2800446 RepID=UPI00196502B1|nr:hypothetical protein [Glycomyces sp. YM15]
MSIGAATPLVPVYPFNRPGEPVILFDGLIGGVQDADIDGKVQLVCSPRPGIEWNINTSSPLRDLNESDVELYLRKPSGDVRLAGFWLSPDRGISNGMSHGPDDALLDRMVVHWFNLPNWIGRGKLTTEVEGQEWWWLGRFEMESNGWMIVFDSRPNLSQVLKETQRSQSYLMTHVMELRRTEDRKFTAIEAQPVLEALHIGISFALGRWAAPMLSVGQDATEETVWMEWGVRHCDPVRSISSGWWFDRDLDSLDNLLSRIIPETANPDKLAQLRLQLMLAITSINDQSFVEQRIINGAAGLEHLEWQELALSGRMSKTKYRQEICYLGIKMNAAGRLRLLLREANISTAVDEILSPAMFEYSEGDGDEVLDGPEVITRIRNKLVHPKGSQEAVYRNKSLLREVWCCTRHYLALLILHSLGYSGSYRDMRKLDGWAGDVAQVPWTKLTTV